jgi:PAS domain S-box-containing protein
MQDQDKARDQLIEELNETRRKLAQAQANQHSSREGEQHALETEHRLRLALDAAHAVVWDWDLKTGRAIWEETYTRMLGYEPNELDPGVRTWKRLVHPDDWGKASEALNKHLSGRLPSFETEYRIRNKHGQFIWIQSRGKVVEYDKDGKPLRMRGTNIDVTELRRATEELKRKTEEQDLLLNTIDTQVWYLTDPETYGMVNQSRADFLGKRREEIEGKQLDDFYSHDVAAVCEVGNAEAFQTKVAINTKEWIPNAAGEPRLISITKTPKLDEHGAVEYVVCSGTDITEYKRLENALRESEQTLNSILTASPVGIAFVTSDRKLRWANKTFLELFGYDTSEEVKDLSVRLFYASEEEFVRAGSLISSFCSKGEPAVTDTILKRKTGKTFDAIVRVNPFDPTDLTKGFVSTVQDISDRKKAENEKIALQAQLFQSQKMESLGTLVGGIAHDFNNMLQIIIGYSQFLMDYHKKGDPGHGDLQAIIETSQEAADLVTKLLAFGQQAQTIPTEFDLNDRIRELSTVISRTLPHIIRLDLDLTDRPTTILADKGEISQLFMNLAINASEAMPDGGDLKVTTSVVSLDEDYCKAHLEAKPGDYVMLSVKDAGRGMDEKTKCCIFDPFFSTKQRGATRGTGLGLSVVKGIAQQRGGHITCESEPGKGTEFKVYFPAIDSKDQPVEPKMILVVEDNDRVAELEKRALESCGYKVIIATNGKEAIDTFQARNNEISLVLLDLILPEKTGRDCLMEMVTIDPSVKVLIASGYSMEGALKDEITPLVKGFVRKPFVITDLINTVHGVLGNA